MFLKATAEWVARESGKEADMTKVKKQLRTAFQASKVRHERKIQAERTVDRDKRVYPYGGDSDSGNGGKRKKKSLFRHSKRTRKSSKQEEVEPQASTSGAQPPDVFEISDSEGEKED